MNVTHLNALKACEAAIRTGSFKAAAAELSVTPAAVGQQIRALERYLGCRLFDRTRNGARPTETAQAVIGQLTNGFSILDGVFSQLRSARGENRVAVTLPSSFAEHWFSHRLSELYQRESELDLRLDASNRMVDLAGEDFDFAIRYCSPSSEEYEEIVLFGDYVLPVCSPSFSEQYELSRLQTSIKSLPLVHLVGRTPDPEWPDWPMWASAMNLEMDDKDSGVHFSQFNSGLQPAISGQGLVLCGIVEAFHAIKTGKLIAPFGASKVYPTSFLYRIVKIRGRKLSLIQRRFCEWIISTSERFNTEVSEWFKSG